MRDFSEQELVRREKINKIKYRNIIILAYVTSYLSHLIIDIFNCKGAQYLFPLKDRYCLKLCKSGSTVDKVFGLFGGRFPC